MPLVFEPYYTNKAGYFGLIYGQASLQSQTYSTSVKRSPTTAHACGRIRRYGVRRTPADRLKLLRPWRQRSGSACG